MPPVVCAVRAPMSRELVQAAVLSCLDRSADLRLVGVVEDKLSDSTRATGGERVTRYKHTRQELDQAAKTAQAAGVAVTTTVRAGDLTREALREAETVNASDLFFAHTRGRIRAALTRKPPIEIKHVMRNPSVVEELATAA
jgi:nucleotide-binding universal stress UspA family protein